MTTNKSQLKLTIKILADDIDSLKLMLENIEDEINFEGKSANNLRSQGGTYGEYKLERVELDK